MVVEKQQILYGSDVAAPTNFRLFGIFCRFMCHDLAPRPWA